MRLSETNKQTRKLLKYSKMLYQRSVTIGLFNITRIIQKIERVIISSGSKNKKLLLPVVNKLKCFRGIIFRTQDRYKLKSIMPVFQNIFLRTIDSAVNRLPEGVVFKVLGIVK